MRLKHPDLMLATSVAMMNVVWALLPSRPPIIGIALALPLVFVLPGYTLTEALFHKRSLDTIYRILLSLGLSLAIDISGGILLNAFPIGLRTISWAALLALLTGLFALLVVYLRRRTLIREMREKQAHGIRFSSHEYILCALAMAVVIFAVAFSAVSVTNEPHAGFTQLWMLPQDQANNNCEVRLGVRSYELTSITYRVQMTVNGVQVNTWPSVVLAPRQEWDRLVTLRLNPTVTTTDAHVEVRLYHASSPGAAYQKVNLTMHIARGESCDHTPRTSFAAPRAVGAHCCVKRS